MYMSDSFPFGGEYGWVIQTGFCYEKDRPSQVLPCHICKPLNFERVEEMSPFYFNKTRLKTWQYDELDNSIGSWISTLEHEYVVEAMFVDGVTKERTTMELSSTHVFAKALVHLDLRHGWFSKMLSELISLDNVQKKKLRCQLIAELLRTPVAAVFVQKHLRSGSNMKIVLQTIVDTVEGDKERLWLLHLLTCGAGSGHNTRGIIEMTNVLLESLDRAMAAPTDGYHFPGFAYEEYLGLMQKAGTEREGVFRRYNRAMARYCMYGGAIFFSLMA